MNNYQFLPQIHSPADLNSISDRDIPALAGEIRQEIIGTLAENGGHLASNLGRVEATLALHRTFSCTGMERSNAIVFDVGHQCYTHKLLTGRFDRFRTVRQGDGLSGFPNRTESPYDSFGVGHASTSISAALGMAAARDLSDGREHVVAVIGDGALSGGIWIAFLPATIIITLTVFALYLINTSMEGVFNPRLRK